jgi:hypothetical protein
LKVARTLAVLFTAALFGAVNCKQVLSIEDAELDPSLSAGGSAGNAGHGGDQDSGGTSGSSGTAGSAGDAGGDVVYGSLCEQYCATLEANCTGQFEVYEDRLVCLETCKKLPPGAEGVTEVNTVHCRLAAAEQAALIEKEFYCPRAGPAGIGPEDDDRPCATACESWCLLMEEVCNDPDAGYDWFTTTEACMSECENVPDLHTFSTAPTAGQLRGNSIQCRLIHVANSTLAPEDHCSHAAGESTCVGAADGG